MNENFDLDYGTEAAACGAFSLVGAGLAVMGAVQGHSVVVLIGVAVAIVQGVLAWRALRDWQASQHQEADDLLHREEE